MRASRTRRERTLRCDRRPSLEEADHSLYGIGIAIMVGEAEPPLTMPQLRGLEKSLSNIKPELVHLAIDVVLVQAESLITLWLVVLKTAAQGLRVPLGTSQSLARTSCTMERQAVIRRPTEQICEMSTHQDPLEDHPRASILMRPRSIVRVHPGPPEPSKRALPDTK